MKIGIDARTYSWSGIGRYVRNLISELSKVDHKNQYVIFLGEDDFEDFEPPTKNFEKFLVGGSYYSFSEQLILPWQIKKAHCDLVHFSHFNFPVIYEKPFVVTIHDLIPYLFPGQKMKRAIHRVAYKFVIHKVVKKALKIIAVSENTRRDLIKYLEVPPEKIKVIYEGVEKRYLEKKSEDEIRAVLQKYKITPSYFLYVGVFRNHKNLPVLLKAFKRYQEEFSKKERLVLVGEKDPEYKEVDILIKKLSLQNQIITPGKISDKDLVCLYQGALAFIFPSLYEGFGLPPLEAMAAGTPVISSRAASLPEILDRAALFFNPKDIDELLALMKRVKSDKELQSNLEKKGLSQVKKYSWKKMAKETLNIYRSLSM